MRLRSWLDAVAKRHAYTRIPRRRKRSPRRVSTLLVPLTLETLEPRQLLTADPLLSVSTCVAEADPSCNCPEDDLASASVPTWQNATTTGNVASSQLTEISGVAASQQNDHVLWVHNDSGDTARLFAMSTEGDDLGTIPVSEFTSTVCAEIDPFSNQFGGTET